MNEEKVPERLREEIEICFNSIIPSLRERTQNEVEKALTEEQEQDTLKLFPVRLDNAIFDARDDWAEKIRMRL